MHYATLTEIIHGLSAAGADGVRLPRFVCPILAKLPGVGPETRISDITPLLRNFLNKLVPELILGGDDESSIMDRWLNYRAFTSSADPKIREMAELLFLEPQTKYIRRDNEFRVKFYNYLLEHFGDMGFEIP